MGQLVAVQVMPLALGLFRGSRNKYIGSFLSFLRVQKSLYADIVGIA